MIGLGCRRWCRGMLVCSSAALLLACIVVSPVGWADEAWTISAGVSLEGIWLGSGASINGLGISAGVGLTEQLSFELHYVEKSIDVLGVKLLGVSFVDVAVSFDPAPDDTVGVHIFGGGGLTTITLYGISLDEVHIGAGFGLRVSLGKKGMLFVRYRFRAVDLSAPIHAVEGGAAIRF